MSLTGRGPADEYRGGRPSRSDRLRREEIQRHIQAFEKMSHPEETDDPSSSQVKHYKRPEKQEQPEAPKTKLGRLWRFLIG